MQRDLRCAGDRPITERVGRAVLGEKAFPKKKVLKEKSMGSVSPGALLTQAIDSEAAEAPEAVRGPVSTGIASAAGVAGDILDGVLGDGTMEAEAIVRSAVQTAVEKAVGA